VEDRERFPGTTSSRDLKIFEKLPKAANKFDLDWPPNRLMRWAK